MADGKALLLAAIRVEEKVIKIARLRSLSEEEWEALLQEAGRHGLVPLLFYYIKPCYPDTRIPALVQERIRRIYYSSATRNMRLFKQLEEVVKKFNQAGIPVILLKGAHLAGFIYTNIALRPMIDIDLLLKSSDLQQAHGLLLELGYSAPEEEAPSNKKHLAPYTKKNGVLLEVHYHITDPPLAGHIDIDPLWTRAEKTFLEQAEVFTLCPEDLFLHLCLHSGVHNAFDNGLVACLDSAQIASGDQIEVNWEQVWCRAQEWGIERAVYLLLALTEKVTGQAMPGQIGSKIQIDEEVAKALAAAEDLVWERNIDLPSSLARFFESRGWINKYRLLKKRALPPKEAVYAGGRTAGRNSTFERYRLYLSRVGNYYKTYRETLWRGLRGDPNTVSALELENKRNRLRDWLTHANKP